MIIFTDIDGTLVDGEMNLPVKTLYALKQLKQNGHQLILITGRNCYDIPECLDFEYDGLVGNSGASIRYHDEEIHVRYVDHNDDIIPYLQSHQIPFYLENQHGCYGSEESYHHMYEKYKKYLQDHNQPEELLHQQFMHYQISDQLYTMKAIRFTCMPENLLQSHHLVDIFVENKLVMWGSTHTIFTEITSKQISKGYAVRYLLNYLNIPLQQCYAIGDSNVDIEMMKVVKHSIAMGNGIEPLKEICEYITDDIHCDGFYKAMLHYNLIKE